jgi:hypothetical protein
MRWFPLAPLFALPTVILMACGGPLADGEAAFKKARYPAAKQAFASLEAEMRVSDDATRAEYALYRGLTLTALGDRAHAAQWLLEAKSLEDAQAGTLREDDARRLSVAIEANEIP